MRFIARRIEVPRNTKIATRKCKRENVRAVFFGLGFPLAARVAAQREARPSAGTLQC